jgi:hypothetical protein
MGYLNKTCSSGTLTSTYGPTVGPVLRGVADKRWAQWTFPVVGQSPDGDDLVTMKTFYPGDRGKSR